MLNRPWIKLLGATALVVPFVILGLGIQVSPSVSLPTL